MLLECSSNSPWSIYWFNHFSWEPPSITYVLLHLHLQLFHLPFGGTSSPRIWTLDLCYSNPTSTFSSNCPMSSSFLLFTLWAFYILACIPSFHYLFPIASCLLLQVHLHNDDGFRVLGGIMLLPTSHLGRQAAWGPPRILTPYHKSHTCNHGGWTLHTKYN